MSAHAEHIEHMGDTATTITFAKVWIALLVLTGIEVLLAYEQVPLLIMLTALLGLSIIKASLIIAYFMHLKFERFSLFLTLFPGAAGRGRRWSWRWVGGCRRTRRDAR
jgi:cytochrome c oxidase subunit IV